ncbi:LysR family transcriptional regulator [Microbacterium sp. 18062]|uniref:LysR family transcriptional regulator n=1 Tax=Microbacterium sp. 18062 TaxID=2681410 RepID=UPI001359F18F|nr:LysR family transcriptional regulator [Microbacterium sp. 18062]
MDLNLLTVFVAVYETGTVTAAAERLFVTQSAVSQSLTRLRRELGDQLFVREGRTLRATPAAHTLYPEFHAALSRVETAVAGLRDFDPTTARHRFRLALSELGEVGFLPTILRSIAAVAPHVEVEVVPLDVRALPEWLARGRVDLAIASTPPPGEFTGPVLKTERYVLLMSADHPLAGRKAITRQAFTDARHLTTSSDSAAPGVGAALERAGLPISPDLVVGHTSSLPGLLHAGPWITVVPSSLAENWMPLWPLVSRPLPVDLAPIHVRLYTRSTSYESSALNWFHRAVVTAVQSAPRRFWSPPETDGGDAGAHRPGSDGAWTG